MKFVIVLLVVCAAVSTFAQQYTSKYDNIDVDQVLSNNRVRANYFKCLMGTGSCTPEGRELKKLLPEALETNCAKCTEVQKKNLIKTFKKFENSNAADWKQLQSKYDPKGIHIAQFRKTHHL